MSGACANRYDYGFQDPINGADLDGSKCTKRWNGHKFRLCMNAAVGEFWAWYITAACGFACLKSGWACAACAALIIAFAFWTAFDCHGKAFDWSGNCTPTPRPGVSPTPMGNSKPYRPGGKKTTPKRKTQTVTVYSWSKTYVSYVYYIKKSTSPSYSISKQVSYL